MPSSRATPVLELKGVTKRFGPLVANDAIDLALQPGEIVALLGQNGAGKTTLMNILFGHYLADAGSVEIEGRPLPPGEPGAALAAGVGMVHQHFTLADNLTVLDNVSLGREPLSAWRSNRKSVRQRLSELAARFGLAVDANAIIADLSVGECQRVEILKALYGDTKVLILDEPTAVLTPGETEELFKTLKQLTRAGLAVIFISHKLGEVMAVADRIVVLRNGHVAGERRVAETDKRALAAMMVGESIEAPPIATVEPGPPLLSLRQVSTAGAHATPLRGIDLALCAGTITGIAGVSGNGQAALADLLSGMTTPVSGRFDIHGQTVARWSPQAAIAAGIGRIAEDRLSVGTIADMSITENIITESYCREALARHGWLDWRAARRRAEAMIQSYDVKCPSPDAPIRLLSGGNMQKLVLGKVLEAEPSVILANQPTRGLDVGAVAYIHARLLEARERGAAILLISEDLDELTSLADTLYVMFDGRLSRPLTRGSANLAQIGELMAGHGFETVSHAA